MQEQYNDSQRKKAREIIKEALGNTDNVRALRDADIDIILGIANLWDEQREFILRRLSYVY